MRRSRAWALAVLVAASACGNSTPSPAPVAGPGTWTSPTKLPEPRFEAYAAASNSRIYFFGGIHDPGNDPRGASVSDQVDVLDPSTLTWSAGPPLPADGPRHHLAIGVVAGTVYLLGGFVGIVGFTPPMTPNGHAYALAGDAWVKITDPPVARGGSTAQAIDGKIYVAGGGSDDRISSAALYIYDPATDAWTEGAPMKAARQHLASCAIDGKMIVAGGWADTKTVLATVESYDPATDTWSTLPDLPTARGGLGATVLGHTCYVLGGETWTGDLPGTFAANQAFDPALGRWTSFASMPTRRHGLGVVAFAGTIWTLGGGPVQGNSYTANVEAFEP